MVMIVRQVIIWNRYVWSLQWRHNECECVSNHQPHECLLNSLFRRRSKKTSKLRVTGLCEGNSPVTGEFPAQRASEAENVSIWWRHHGFNKSAATELLKSIRVSFWVTKEYENGYRSHEIYFSIVMNGDCTKSYWDIINGLVENLVWQNACQPHVRAMLSWFHGHCHSLVYHEATRHIYVGLPLSSFCILEMRHIDLHVLIITNEYWAALVMKSEFGLIQSDKAIHGNCWYIGYPLGSHLEPRFRLFIKSSSLSQSINKFAQSAELSLPCSVKSCEMTGQVRNNSWAMRFRQICIQCEFRKCVLYCNISRSLMTTQGTATEV